MEPTPFRATNNNFRLRKLFYETCNDGTAIYTLKDRDLVKGDKTYLSLYRLYMETEDLTEYEFATQYLDSWAHWQVLIQCTWFIPYVNRWREELDLKTKAAALKMIQKEAKDKNSKNLFQANKVLIDRSWENKSSKMVTPRGRPSKEEVQGELLRQVEEERRVDEDLERIQELLDGRTRDERNPKRST